MLEYFDIETFKKSLVLLIFFIIITIISYNLLKGNKVILPDLEEEFFESKDLYLIKAIGIALVTTFILAFITIYQGPQEIYAVTKAIKVNNV
jgi:hypothetical protein